MNSEMPWYRVRIPLDIDGVRYFPGDVVDLPEGKALLLKDGLIPEGGRRELNPKISPGGRVDKIKDLDPWWKRLWK